MALTDVNNINTILIQFSSHGFNTSDSISYDASYADSLGITGSGNQYSYIFKAKSKNSVSTANWEKFLQSITYTTYDAATFTSTGVSGGVTIFWYADENLWENNMFYDSSSGHFYACINTGNSITWGEARNRALSMYNSALDCYGYLAHITSQSEQDYLYTLMDKSTQGWLGATRKVSGNEWDWYWRDGPANETSEPFFRQNADGTYDTLLWGYENWDSKTEPNNSGGVEWCMHYYGSNRGVWNDYIDSNGAVTSFIVEWSKDGLVGNDHSVSDTDVIGTQIVAEQEQKVNNGEVSGTVWAENDYNGLFATDEAKLQDITVQLISDNGTVVATAQTNKLGQYDFTGLAPGNYYVKFTSQSFVGYNAVPDGGNSIVQQASKGINDSYAQTPVFALTYNDVLEKSFGVYVPSTVSGFAWDDANQNGIYDNREAKIANVTITLTDADGNSLTDVYGNPIAAVLTDANGNYSFTNVRPRKEMKLTLTSSNTVDISNARVSPIPASGDVKLTNKAEKSIGMLEFNGAPTSATTEKSGSMLTSATIGEIYINSMSGTGITPVNAEYKNFALSANNSIRGYVWVESDYNGILDGWHETQADIDIEEPVLNGVKVTLKNAAGATVATTYTDFAGYYEFLALKPGTYKVEYEETDRTAADKKVLPEEYDYFGFTVSPTATTDKKTQMGNDSTAVMQNNKVAKAVSKTYQIPDTRVVNLSNEKDFYVSTANCALYIPSKVYGYIWQDDNYNGIREANETQNVETHIYLRRTTKSKFADADEQGTNISGHLLYKSYNVFGELIGNGDLNTATDGYYEYNCLEPGIYYVVFDNTYDCYGQTLINQGNDDTLDSEAQPNISLDRSHMYCAWIGDIELPVNTKTEYNVLSKHNDAGFIRLLTSFDLKKVEDLSGIPFENVKFDYEIYSKAENFGKSVFPDDRHQGAPQIYEGAEDSGKSVFSDDSNELYTTASIETFAQAEHLITDKDGLIHFTNQDIATYHLTETKTLPGYVRDTKTHVIKVMPETTVENNNLVWKTYISVDGVRQTDNLYTLKNTSETTNLTVTKKWDDANDQDGIRQNAVITLKGTVTLPDGKTEAVPLQKAYTALFKATDTYLSYTFRSIPAYYKGQTIQYTVIENPMDGYTATVGATTGSADKGYAITVTNKHVPQFDDFTVTKVWDDSNNIDGMRPDSVTIHLNGSDTQKSVTTTAGFDLTNTHEIQTADYEVKKVWVDDNDRDGARPTSITLTLTGSDGSKYTKQMTAVDNWNAATFERVPMFNGGKYITYTLTENEVPSYMNSIEVSEDGKHFTVTNTHAPDHTVINITEVWHDENDQDGIRPRKMTAVVVGSNGNRHEVPLHSSGDWHYTCDDLVKYWKNGQLVDYTVEAVTIDGYTSEVKSLGNNVFEVHNTHIPETISKTVTKTWKDNENQDGIRPASVTVTLTGSNAVSKTATLNEDNGWTATFENLPKRDHGNIVAYNVKESDTAGYEASVVKTEDGFQLINEHDSETTMRTVTLVWRDEDNRDGVRPDAVTYTLHGSDGSEQKKTVNKDDAWNDVVFEDLPVYQNGQRISYTLAESAIDGYANDIRSSGNTFTVTNTHIPETVNVDVTKIWTDGENQDGNRPDSISVILTGSDGKRYTTTITAAINWKHTFLKLPKFFNEGTQIEYTLTEDTMSGYSDVVEKRSDYVFVLTNKYSPATVDVTIVKKWDDDNDRDGMRPESVDIVLNGSDGKLYTGTLSTENGYTCVFQSVPKYHDGGTLINYTIAEEKIPGYTTTIAKDASGYKFTLTNAKTIDIVTKTVSKVWDDNNNQDGLRPTAITVILTGDDGSRRVKSVTAAENWTVTFENLPKNQNHGQNIQYTVSEAFVSGYTEAITQNGDNYTITNTHTPASSEFFVTKIWKDNGNNDGMRPDEITVTAHGSDGRSYTEKLNADNQWSVMFSNLPKYADGKVIEYSLTEESVPGYTSSITRNGKSFVLINTHVDETKNITITKAWNDENNQDGLRPKTITAVVNGSDGSARFVQLFEGQNWATNLNNLPKYKNGTEIQYTVKENAIPGYETEIKQTGDSYAITNSHTPAVVTVSAVKVWDDANNQDGIRPSLIQVTLTGSDGSVRNAAITKNDGWTYQFKNLPKYKNGVKIDYTLQEANSNPYTYEIVKGSDEYSFTITNNYVPAVVNVPVTTVWDDDDNRDGIRAKETAITLQGSNGKVYQRIVTGKDDFATVFEDVPKFFDEGREVVYTVTQNEMNGYTANIANTDKYTFQITNTHEPERLAKTVTKVWDDNNNQDGLRPNTLRIALTGTDGTYIEKSLSTANNWTEAFDGLYKYFKEGTPIQYTIDEEMVGGYEKEISEKDNLITITNTHAPEKLDLIVNVVWNDANNQDGYRPDAATIHMSGTDGTQDAKDFTKDSSWSSIVFKDLDHYKDGNEIKYTVAEDEIPQYTTSIAVNGNVVTVTNTHIPEITLRNISVVWEDNNDQDGLRPDTVSVKLKGNDKFIDSSELNEDVKWKHSFTKLPVRENGNEITYTAEENEIPGYTTSIEKTDTGYVFTNTHIPETVTVTVDKVWDDSENQDGLRPDTIHIKLVSNGIAKDAYLDADSNWHLEFEGLPKYRDHGILNEYSVQEVDVDGYTSTVTTKDGYAFTIENDHVPAVIDIPITEEWIDDNDRDGLRPDSHTVVLVDGTNAIEEVVLDKNNGYGVVLKNMPKYKNGVEINYQIKDFKVDGYTTNIIKSDSVKDFNITNTHVPEMVTVTVTEGWHDQSDYDKIRPEKVTLTLTGSDGNVYEKTVTKDTWTTAFSDLPKNSKGEQIIYTLTQEGIKGYKTTITDNETGTIAVINTHEPVKTITVAVTWNDENNKDNIRPDKVTVKLANGTTAVSTKEINNDSWKHVFENIIVFNGSDKASYTVTQDAVNGYTTEIKASDDGNTIEIINTHVPVAPPKEEPKQEETATPATPAPVVEIKTEPTTTVIETPNKQTGISFMDGLFG